MVYDLIINLYNIEPSETRNVIRVLSPDSDKLIDFINNNFTKGWASEVKSALYQPNSKCFIKVVNQEIVGFACYDATAKGFFGPTGVRVDQRGLGIGKELLSKTLASMKEDGYAYAIVGAVSLNVYEFYKKTYNATIIESSNINSIYNRLLNRN